MKNIGKLGFFDSGIGGLTVMSEFHARYPEYDMVYFGDRANCPYGDRTHDEIVALVESGVERLIRKWAVIIILACNTAVAEAIRYLQEEKYPLGSGIKILGVTLPWAQKVVELGCKKVGILATASTVKNRAYRERVRLLDSSIVVEEIAVPWLVNLIEAEVRDPKKIEELLRSAINRFDPENEALVLWCTHYPMVRDQIEQLWYEIHGKSISIIDPGREAAEKFGEYLKKHSEFELLRTKSQPQLFFS